MIILFKPVGKTPLQCLQRELDTKNNTYAYAGRLDPMAEGLLLVLENNECKSAEKYRHLNKIYKYQFIVGVGTDSYDCLGRITDVHTPSVSVREKVSDAIGALSGVITLRYPPYSSKTVNGIPLFKHAQQNTLNSITMPEKTVEIFSHTLNKTNATTVADFKKYIIPKLLLAPDGFRKEESIADWNRLNNGTLQHFSATVHGSAGTYVRSVVHEIGKQIGYPTSVTTITRIQIGEWTRTGYYR